MEKKKISKLNIKSKILSVLPRLLYDILIFFCVVLIAIIVLQRLTDSNQSFYGYRIFRVVSGSMVPEYDVGEVVICKDVNANEIMLGDVIVYRGNVGELNNRLIMHEVVDIDRDENDYLIFHVKGIQNTTGDPDVKESQVLGVVSFKSGILTLLYSLATSIYSSFVIIMILVINVFISFKPTRKPKQLSEHNELSEEKKVEKQEEQESNVEKKEVIENENSKKDETEIKEEKTDKKAKKNKKEVKEESKEKETSEEKQDDESKDDKKENEILESKEDNIEKDSKEKIDSEVEEDKSKNVTKKKKTTKSKK